jgi:hypothetical protein
MDGWMDWMGVRRHGPLVAVCTGQSRPIHTLCFCGSRPIVAGRRPNSKGFKTEAPQQRLFSPCSISVAFPLPHSDSAADSPLGLRRRGPERGASLPLLQLRRKVKALVNSPPPPSFCHSIFGLVVAGMGRCSLRGDIGGDVSGYGDGAFFLERYTTRHQCRRAGDLGAGAL